MQYICVFASASSDLSPAYYRTAHALGATIAKAGVGMVFGAGRTGLMGAAAEGVASCGGKLIGVLPEKLNRPGIAFARCTELIVLPTMHERKERMEQLACAFIALPGGFGTIEELFEVITLKQLGYHSHPIVILNDGGFYDSMLQQCESIFALGFSDPAFRALYSIAATPQEAVEQVLHATHAPLPDKLVKALDARTSSQA